MKLSGPNYPVARAVMGASGVSIVVGDICGTGPPRGVVGIAATLGPCVAFSPGVTEET